MHQALSKHRKQLVLWLTAFVLIAALICYFLYLDWQKKVAGYLHQHSSAVTTSYRASIDGYAVTTRFLVNEVIRKPEVIATFARGVDGDHRARGQLFRLLAPTYDELVTHGIRQLHFHTASGHSFLRFHALDKYGDPLFDVRPTLRIANSEQRYVYGFEAGRVISGFRYVHPLFEQHRHLGTVETSLSFRIIREAMMRHDPDRDYLLVLPYAAVEGVVFSDTRGLYAPWDVNPDFFMEDPQLTLPDSPPPPGKDVLALNNLLAGDADIRRQMTQGIHFSLSKYCDNRDWAITFLPIFDVEQQLSGYLVSYTTTPYLHSLRQEFFHIVGLVLMATAAILILSYLLWQSLITKAAAAAHLATITNTIGDAVYVLDAAGKVTFINPAFTRLLGFTEADMIGQIGHDLFHRHNRQNQTIPLENCPIYTRVRDGVEYEGEDLFVTKTGVLLEVSMISRPILDRQGNAGGSSVTAFRDISKRKQMENDLLRKTTDLKRNNADLLRLGEVMAHHFQESTRRIATFARVLRNQPCLQQNPDSRNAVTFIDEQATRLSSLVRRVQRYLELDESVPGETSAADVRTLIHQALSASAAADADIDITADLLNVPLPTMRLHRILAIVFDNCGNYRRANTPLVIQISAVITPDQLELRIADNGSGIDPAHRDKVLELFTNLATGKNSGSGLALARRIMRLAGGDLRLEDGIDGGVSVVLMFKG